MIVQEWWIAPAGPIALWGLVSRLVISRGPRHSDNLNASCWCVNTSLGTSQWAHPSVSTRMECFFLGAGWKGEWHLQPHFLFFFLPLAPHTSPHCFPSFSLSLHFCLLLSLFFSLSPSLTAPDKYMFCFRWSLSDREQKTIDSNTRCYVNIFSLITALLTQKSSLLIGTVAYSQSQLHHQTETSLNPASDRLSSPLLSSLPQVSGFLKRIREWGGTHQGLSSAIWPDLHLTPLLSSPEEACGGPPSQTS